MSLTSTSNDAPLQAVGFALDHLWPSYEQLRQRCEDLAAVDYYLAVEMVRRTLSGRSEPSSEEQQQTWLFSIAALSRALRDGHSCLDLQALAGSVVWRSPVSESLLDETVWQAPALDTWRAQLQFLSGTEDTQSPIILSGNRLYLRRYWCFEQEVASRLHPLMSDLRFMDSERARRVLRTLFPTTTDTPTQTTLFEETPQRQQQPPDWQEVAVANALRRRLAIIAGGPGTGKTTSVIKLLYALVALFPDLQRIQLTAPTGKAAQRLTESVQSAKDFLATLPGIDHHLLQRIPSTASTVHRLLGVIPNALQFRHHQENPLDLDVLLLDEVSMVDLPLMARLLRALPDHCRIIMLGDADQLPSVAAGSVLADLAPRPFVGYSRENTEWLEHVTGYRLPAISSPLNPGVAPEIRAALGHSAAADHVVFLQRSHRFSDASAIGRLAQQVISGNTVASWQTLSGATGEVEWVPADTDLVNWVAALTDRYFLAIHRAESLLQAWRALQQFRLLAAVRQGPQGVVALNELVELRLKQLGRIPRGTPEWYDRRPVMVTQNHYGVRLFNGDVGLTWRAPDGRLRVYFETGQFDEHGQPVFRAVAPGRLPPVETLYAMTVHKTQGSEFNHVAIVLPEVRQRLLSRELIYTGITRARELVSVWTNQTVWQQSVNAAVVRYSGLGEKLQTPQ